MGKGKKSQPSRLPVKLLQIRKFFGFSQDQMIKFISPDLKDTTSSRPTISDYESGRRTPTLLEALRYATTVRQLSQYKQFNVEDLICDHRDLPFDSSISTGNEKAEIDVPIEYTLKPPPLSSGTELGLKTSWHINPKYQMIDDTSETEKTIENGMNQDKGNDMQLSSRHSSEQPSDNQAQPIEVDIYVVDLPKRTLASIDDIRLYLLKQMPYFWRPQLTEERFVELLLEEIITEYGKGPDKCSVIETLRERFTNLPVNSSELNSIQKC